MKSNILFAQIIFSSLISLIISEKYWVGYNHKTNSGFYQSSYNPKMQMIVVDFRELIFPYYMKITLTLNNSAPYVARFFN